MALWIDYFQHIKARRDFFPALDQAIQRTHDLLKKAPGDPYLTSILRQLDAMKGWTANGRDPTRAERKSLTIGQILVREFEPAPTDEIEDWTKLVREVKGYFEEWLTDQRFQSIDEDDLDPFA